MSVLRITIPGARFAENAIDRSIKLTTNRTGLVGEFIFGSYAAACNYNGADRTKPLRVIGEPTFSQGRVALGQNNWLDTQSMFDTQELTFLVFPARSASAAMPFGTFSGSNSGDTVSIYGNTGTMDMLVSTTGEPSTVSLSTPSIDVGSFYGIAGRTTGSANFTIKLDAFKGGARLGGVSAVQTGKTRKVTTTMPFAFGSSRGNASFPGPVVEAGGLVWNRALSDAELLAAYIEARTLFTARGIAV